MVTKVLCLDPSGVSCMPGYPSKYGGASSLILLNMSALSPLVYAMACVPLLASLSSNSSFVPSMSWIGVVG